MADRRAFRLELHQRSQYADGATMVASERVVSWDDARAFLARVRAEMREIAQSGKCGALILAVHQHGEDCDHE